MKKRTQVILFILLSVSLLFSTNIAFSQGGGASYFAEYAFSIICEMGLTTSLGGTAHAGTLADIRDHDQRGFDAMIAEYEGSERYQAADIAKVLRKARMNFLDEQIAIALERDKAKYSYYRLVIGVISDVLGVDSANEDTIENLNTSAVDEILPVLQKQTKQNAADLLYGHIASRIPGSGAAISSSSPAQIYHIDAGIPSLSAPLIISNNGNSGDVDVNIQKPLRFANAGLYDATVRAFSYTPAEGVTAGISRASTVVFRGSNPSANLSLPLGTYVFCYDWDLGTDADKDGYVDYAHKNTGSVTLTIQSTDNPNSAQVVTLDPGNNQNGKCGETAPSTSGSTLSLTPQELVNQGTHTYAMNCVCNGAAEQECNFWGGDWDPFAATIDFVEGGVNLTDEEGATYFQTRLGVNTYDYADNMVNGVLTFTDVGIIYSGEGLICTALRR